MNLGCRIVTTWMPGITARDTLDAQPGTCKQAVSGQCITCIMGTAWAKTTRRRTERADKILVTVNDFYQDSAHLVATRLKRLFKLSLPVFSSVRSALRDITTRSRPHFLIGCTRNNSLISRFARFLSTDLGMNLLATTIPSLALLN